MRLNANGIDLASSLSTENVTNFLKNLRGLDFTILGLTIYGIRVSDFQPPNYFRKLVRPNTLRWGFAQGQLAISGGFKQTIVLPGLPMDQQTVEANITVASGSTSLETVSLITKDVENRPTLIPLSCNATMGILNITVTGNTALTGISEFVKNMIVDRVRTKYRISLNITIPCLEPPQRLFFAPGL